MERQLTEESLQTLNGLIARCRNLEGLYMKSHNPDVYSEVDKIRWTLRTEWGVDLRPYAKKLLPDTKGAA